jgi:hypothetical protein
MILHNIVPIKIIDNTFYEYRNSGPKFVKYDLDFKTYFISLSIDLPTFIRMPPEGFNFQTFEELILNMKFKGTFSDKELKGF